MGAATADLYATTYNICGLVNGHAYTLLSAFTMSGHKVLLLRSPWGLDYSKYNARWNAND